mmetsp:Transcript_45540/g.113083  ORF Transcript_45540/g.113083 Transcript_45540/m.113083 type:complete len:110 (-) Transcript_45540:951-1280(-)
MGGHQWINQWVGRTPLTGWLVRRSMCRQTAYRSHTHTSPPPPPKHTPVAQLIKTNSCHPRHDVHMCTHPHNTGYTGSLCGDHVCKDVCVCLSVDKPPVLCASLSLSEWV